MPAPPIALLRDVYDYIIEWKASRPADVLNLTITAATRTTLTVTPAIPAGDYRLHFVKVTDPTNVNKAISRYPFFAQSAGGSTIELLYPNHFRNLVQAGYKVDLVCGPISSTKFYFNTVDAVEGGSNFDYQTSIGIEDEIIERYPQDLAQPEHSRIKSVDLNVFLVIQRYFKKGAADTLNKHGGLEALVTQYQELVLGYNPPNAGLSIDSEMNTEYYVDDDQGLKGGEDTGNVHTGITYFNMLFN